MSVEQSDDGTSLRRISRDSKAPSALIGEEWVYVQRAEADDLAQAHEVDDRAGLSETRIHSQAATSFSRRSGLPSSHGARAGGTSNSDFVLHNLSHPIADLSAHDNEFSGDADSVVSETSLPEPPAVQKYFDVAGNISVLRERRTELQTDIEENVMQRAQMLHEEEMDRRSAYEAIDASLMAEHQELTRAIADAEHTLFEHKLACRVEGVNPASFRFRRISSCNESRTRYCEAGAGWLQGKFEEEREDCVV